MDRSVYNNLCVRDMYMERSVYNNMCLREMYMERSLYSNLYVRDKYMGRSVYQIQADELMEYVVFLYSVVCLIRN